jgi:hypothetical protein
MEFPASCRSSLSRRGQRNLGLITDAASSSRHLGCRASREREQQNAHGVGAIQQQMRHPMGQSVRLAGARSRDDQQRTRIAIGLRRMLCGCPLGPAERGAERREAPRLDLWSWNFLTLIGTCSRLNWLDGDAVFQFGTSGGPVIDSENKTKMLTGAPRALRYASPTPGTWGQTSVNGGSYAALRLSGPRF